MEHKRQIAAATKAVQTVFEAAEQIVAAKRAWERTHRAAERKAPTSAKGKGGHKP